MQKSISIPYTKEQTVISSPSNSNRVLLAVHGYGQLSTFFFKNFKEVNLQEWQVICPEAPNYFYLEGFSGRVGAHWMTKHNRLQCISENNTFLSQVIEKLNPDNRPLVGLGFSQGANTILRWVMDETIKLDRIILWGGGFPHDYLNVSEKIKHLKNIHLHYVLGKQDEFITPQSASDLSKLFDKLQLKYTITWYEGGHKIYPDVLAEILNL